jgi:hypothetical protein
MRGGITSGIVYPGLISKLAERCAFIGRGHRGRPHGRG